jgi:hypothetical protein
MITPDYRGIIGLSDGSYPLLVSGRILQGFGIMSSLSQIYLVEISDAKRRYSQTQLL